MPALPGTLLSPRLPVAPARNWSPRVISQGFQGPISGSSGSFPTQSAGPVGTVPVHLASAPSVAVWVSAFCA
jgi:hypothetical protein